MTKVYMRNPYEYIDQLIDSDYRCVSWDTGSFTRRSIDPIKFIRMRLGDARPWELMTIAVEGASIYNEHSPGLDKPVAVYPCWLPDQGFDHLRDLCERPCGDDDRLTKNEFTPKRFRPIKGQPHVVVVYDVKDISTNEGLNWYRQLRRVIKDYPKVQFYVHGTRSWRIMFGGDFDACTFNPWWSAMNGQLNLPNGSSRSAKEIRKVMPWIKLLGYSLSQFKDGNRNVIAAYNLESARWAADNYLEVVDFRLRAQSNVDIETPGGQYELRDARSSIFEMPGARIPMKPGDGVLCAACSLAVTCKFYREGAVCGVPSTDAAKLAAAFGSRDADTILDGLSKIAEIQATRVVADLDAEAVAGERLPETDKRLKDLFESGVKIAKLRKPELNGKGTTVNVGVVGGAAIVQRSTPQELIAGAVKALEDRGVPRDQITNDTVIGLLEAVAHRDGAAQLEDIIDAEMED